MNLTYKNLTELPPLPDDLKGLWCYRNQLTRLPSLPPNLINLWCSNNLITELPPLPPGLTNLSCHNNPMTQLPPLPNELEIIWISLWQIHSCLNNLTNSKTGVRIMNCK
jgi:Leucine-rich repeat (LRR) protein